MCEFIFHVQEVSIFKKNDYLDIITKYNFHLCKFFCNFVTDNKSFTLILDKMLMPLKNSQNNTFLVQLIRHRISYVFLF